MAIGGVVINFAAKTTDAIRDVGKLSKSLGDMGKEGGKAAGKQGIGGLVSSMGAAVPIVGAVAIGAVGAATALGEMAKQAWEDKRQADRLANTLGNIPGITQKMIDKNEEWITSMQLATLVSDTDLRAAISKLTIATGDLGEAQTLAALAADVAAGSGKNYATVATAMAKAADGNTAALAKLIPGLDAGTDGTLTLAEAQKQLGEKFKGAAAQAAKNDPWKRIGIIWDELKEIIGSSLLPVLEDLSDWFASKKNQQKIQDFLNRMQDLADVVGQHLKKALEDLIAWLKKPENQQKLKDWADQAKDLGEAFLQIARAVQSVIAALNRLPNPPGWLKNFIPIAGILGGRSAPPGPAGVGPQATAATAPAVRISTLNFYGTGDVSGDAARLKRILESDDLRQGRGRGQPLRLAW